MSLLPRISIPVGWHMHSHWTIAPVTVSFNHSVFCTFAHTPEKFHGNRIQDERDIIIFSVFAVPAVSAALRLCLIVLFPIIH
jgi:hypothetical protein